MAVSSFHDAVNPGVESGEGVEHFFGLVQHGGVAGQWNWLVREEVGAKTLVGVEQDSVDVVVELGGHVLGEELHLPHHVSALLHLGRSDALLSLLVPHSDGIGHVAWLDSGNVEASSEGVDGVVWVVEQIVEGGVAEVLVLLVDLGQHDWGHGDLGLEGSLLGVLLVGDLGQASSQFGGVDEGHDVRVVLEEEHVLLVGLIDSHRSDSNNGSLSQVWELELESEGVEGLSGVVSELELVGVLVELEDLQDLHNHVEVVALVLGSLELNGAISANVGRLEEVVGPLLEGLLDGNILSLEGGSLSREGVWGLVSDGLAERRQLVGGVERPGAELLDVDVELSSALVDSELGSVHSDDVTDSVHDGEVLELVGVDDDGSEGSFVVEGWVNNLEGADELVSLNLVGESGINDHTIEVAWHARREGGLGQLDVLVLNED